MTPIRELANQHGITGSDDALRLFVNDIVCAQFAVVHASVTKRDALCVDLVAENAALRERVANFEALSNEAVMVMAKLRERRHQLVLALKALRDGIDNDDVKAAYLQAGSALAAAGVKP